MFGAIKCHEREGERKRERVGEMDEREQVLFHSPHGRLIVCHSLKNKLSNCFGQILFLFSDLTISDAIVA